MPRPSNRAYWDEVARQKAKNERRNAKRAASRKEAIAIYGSNVTAQQVWEFRKRAQARAARVTDAEATATPESPNAA